MFGNRLGLVWESYKLDPYVERLAACVFLFHKKVDDLLAIKEQIDADVRSLETCEYSAKMVDDQSLHQYSNLEQWVTKLEEVEKRLTSAFKHAFKLGLELI